jgi:hypothetical protein
MTQVLPDRAKKACDYKISAKDADELKDICGLPHEFRLMRLKQLFAHNPIRALELFSQFIGLSNSVVANHREMCEEILIKDGHMWPQSAEKANLPTIFGALNGIGIAATVNQRKTCHACAFRLGTCANQSPSTTCAVDWAINCNERFMCHLELDESGEPTKVCAGYKQLAVANKE